MDLGSHLLPSHISNRKGHFEDSNLVQIHDLLLANKNTNWQFHDEVDLDTGENNIEELKKYTSARDKNSVYWGAKDPRFCLFLNEWHHVLGERGSFLFVLRHWSASIESLLNRHSRELAYNPKSQIDSVHFKFWSQPTLAARMWLSYCSRILDFVKKHPEKSILVTQRALFEGVPLLTELNQRFGFNFDENAQRPFKEEWLNDVASERLKKLIPKTLSNQLEQVWMELLSLTELKSDDERPVWLKDKREFDDSLFNESLSTTKMGFSVAKTAKFKKTTHSKLIEVLSNSDHEDLASVFDTELFISDEVESTAYKQVSEWCVHEYPTNQPIQTALAFWLQRHKEYELAKNAWH